MHLEELIFVGLEHVFAYAAFGADKIFWKLFERDIVVLGRIIDPTTGDALPFLHGILH